MALLRTATAAFAISLLGLPALAEDKPATCEDYIHSWEHQINIGVFDLCFSGGKWPFDEDGNGILILVNAIRSGADKDVIRHIIDAGAATAVDGLLETAQGGNEDLMIWFLDSGVDPNAIGRHGETALRRVLSVNMGGDHAQALRLARILVDAGADPNLRTDEYGTGSTAPMHLAAIFGPAMLDLLIAAGGDVNLPAGAGRNDNTTEGFTPLHAALIASHHMPEVDIAALLERGADPLKEAANGMRPIDLDAPWAVKAFDGLEVDPAAMELVKAAASKS